MKKNLVYLVAAMATASMAITSCGNDSDQVVSAPKEAKTIDLNAYLNNSPRAFTRADSALQSTELQDWTSIGVYVFENGKFAATTDFAGYENYSIKSFEALEDNSKFKLTPDSAMFYPFSGSAVDVYLYAPRMNAPVLDRDASGIELKGDVKLDQSADSSYVASDLIFGKYVGASAAANKGVADVSLKHKLSKIIVKVTASKGLTLSGVSKIELNGLAANYALDFETGTVTSETGKSYRKNFIVASVNPGDTIALKEFNAILDKGVAAIVPPQRTNNAEIVVTMNGKTCKASLAEMGETVNENTETLESGKAYVINVLVKADAIVVNAVAVTDWVDGGKYSVTMSEFE